MKVLNGEGLATHAGSESCVGSSNRAGEALTGGRAGRVLSREKKTPLWRGVLGADALEVSGRLHRACRNREARLGLARSETPNMYGRISHGNREIPRVAAG